MTDRTLAATLATMRADITSLQRRLSRFRSTRAQGTGLRRGTGAERQATPSSYWDFWSDTDGEEHLYVGDKAGGWRRFSGTGTAPATAWDTTLAVGGANIFAGRTISATLPTVVLETETLILTQVQAGSGFGAASLATLVRNPNATPVTIRHTQMASFSTQSLTYAWMLARR